MLWYHALRIAMQIVSRALSGDFVRFWPRDGFALIALSLFGLRKVSRS